MSEGIGIGCGPVRVVSAAGSQTTVRDLARRISRAVAVGEAGVHQRAGVTHAVVPDELGHRAVLEDHDVQRRRLSLPGAGAYRHLIDSHRRYEGHRQRFRGFHLDHFLGRIRCREGDGEPQRKEYFSL